MRLRCCRAPGSSSSWTETPSETENRCAAPSREAQPWMASPAVAQTARVAHRGRPWLCGAGMKKAGRGSSVVLAGALRRWRSPYAPWASTGSRHRRLHIVSGPAMLLRPRGRESRTAGETWRAPDPGEKSVAARALGHSGSCGGWFEETHWLGKCLWERVTVPTSSQPHFVPRTAGIGAREKFEMTRRSLVRQGPAGWWGCRRDRPTVAPAHSSAIPDLARLTQPNHARQTKFSPQTRQSRTGPDVFLCPSVSGIRPS